MEHSWPMDYQHDSNLFYMIVIRNGSLVFGTFDLYWKAQEHTVSVYCWFSYYRLNICMRSSHFDEVKRSTSFAIKFKKVIAIESVRKAWSLCVALSVLAISMLHAGFTACLLACNSYEYIQGHLRTTTARIFLDFSRQNDPVVSSAILLLRRGSPRARLY